MHRNAHDYHDKTGCQCDNPRKPSCQERYIPLHLECFVVVSGRVQEFQGEKARLTILIVHGPSKLPCKCTLDKLQDLFPGLPERVSERWWSGLKQDIRMVL